MFDLKKRRSLPLSCSKDTEEFRRVAVRRKRTEDRGHADGDIRFSYSCRHLFERVCGSVPKSKLETEEDDARSPAKRSLHKPQVSPKPALQSPVRSGPQLIKGHKEEDDSLNGRYRSLSNPLMNCYSHTSPRTFFHFAPTPTLQSPSSANVGIESFQTKIEGTHSLAKNKSPLLRKLRTPSPFHGERWTCTPAKNSKSWLGPHKIPNSDRQERSRPKSLSVPDLIANLEAISSYPAQDDCSLPLHPDSSSETSIKLLSDQTNSPTTKEKMPRMSKHLEENGIDQVNESTALNGSIRRPEKAFKTAVKGGKFYCKWSEDLNINSDHEEAHKSKEEGCVKNEDNSEQKLCKIANEFLQTERAYVARLHLLDQVFCSRLTEEASRGSFPPEVIKNIFSNISSIYSFHSHFLLPDLENSIRQQGDSPGLGSVLLQHAPFMRMYADYMRNFDQSLDLVRTWTERSSSFRNIIQEIEMQQVCGSLTLQHHMLEPVQRLPRYEMLLRDYLKKLPEDSPDFEPAQKSLQTISMATAHSNSAIEKAEGLRKLLEIYDMVGEEDVVNPTNEFLKEGRLVKLAARNTSAMERQLFLFNNFLLCCSSKFSVVGQRYTVRCRIGVDGMNVQQTVNEGHQFTFQVSGKEKTVELQASSEEERDEWIKVIQEAINVFQKKNETFKMATRDLNVEEQTRRELGRRAPKWIRDNEVTMCMKCQEPFNPLTRRRHHCRACGSVVCWKCSDNKAPLEYDGYKLNKVCKSCYLILITQREERLRTESNAPVILGLMSGILLYGDNLKTVQRMWTVLPKNEPPVLYLYTAPQDVKPRFTIPLLGYTVEDCSQGFHGQASFCLKQSKITHTFFCDNTDLKHRWLAVLKVAVQNTIAPSTLSESCNVSDCSSSTSEDYVIIADSATQ